VHECARVCALEINTLYLKWLIVQFSNVCAAECNANRTSSLSFICLNFVIIQLLVSLWDVYSKLCSNPVV
jgi:hypothetical protein